MRRMIRLLGIVSLALAAAVLLAPGGTAHVAQQVRVRSVVAGEYQEPIPATATVSSTPTNTPTPTASQTPACCHPTISVVEFAFQPNTITVHAGDTVRWANNGIAPHTTTSTDHWDSETLAQGQSFDFTFNTPGTYPYQCSIHPALMAGVVVVLRATVTPTFTPTPLPTSSAFPGQPRPGIITTIAGIGTPGYSGDGGSGRDAAITEVHRLAEISHIKPD